MRWWEDGFGRILLGNAGLASPVPTARNEAILADFKRVSVEAYAIPAWAGSAWVDATLSAGIGRSPWRMFVGYL